MTGPNSASLKAPSFVGSLAGSLVLLVCSALPAHAGFFSLSTPLTIQCQVRSQLAEGAGDRMAAIAWAESLAQLDPRSSYASSRIALLNEEVGEDATALAWGERALALDSLNAEAAMLVGRMRLRSGEPSLAVQVLTPPLRQLGAQPELYALRALAHELERNFEGALADLRRTDVLLPDFAWIATGILSLALEDGRWEEANSALRLALELKPGDARTLSLGVSLAQRTGNLELEETLLRELALVQDPRIETLAGYGAFLLGAGRERDYAALLDWTAAHGFPVDQTRLETGRGLLQRGMYREALDAVRPLHKDERVVPIRARAHLALGKEREALEDYRRLIPGKEVAREESLIVAYLEIRVGDKKSGIRTLETVRLRPLESPRQVLAASLCYSLLGHPEEALDVIRESASRGLSSPSMYEELGSTATQVGDSLLAQWAFERLRDMGRETSECLYFLASAELGQGDAGKAIQTLNRAVELNPRNGKALTLLGKLRHRQGQLELARETLIRAAGCPETAAEANRELARVCRTLRLDSEAREAESKAKASRPAPPAGLTLFQNR